MITVSILTDNSATEGFDSEHGLSLFIEHADSHIIFDTGNSNIFLENAKKLDIPILDISTAVVLSHGHWDHGNGLRFLPRKTLIAHPAVCTERFRKKDNSYIGINLTQAELETQFSVMWSKQPQTISDNIIFLGEIPRVTRFESQQTPFITAQNTEDFVPDDSGIVIIHNNSLIIISGCAHAGICNTILHAQHITGIKEIAAIIGGFHLHTVDATTIHTLDFLKQQTMSHIYPSHCTGKDVAELLQEITRVSPTYAGMKIRFPL